ncbi:hypothetical protein EYF80_010789 [Liparis tanakae]|uniref:Uncharacterized protein n=1 Tax=Liparis tanakae TaxID=230148 RepID=A0A4Z2IM30_9TELE|nr:hypothetical protein EYF80_010789 [Liparis tanakae]
MAWTQWMVPVLSHTKSPGRWMNRYTGTLVSYRSSRLGHHEPIRKLMLFLREEEEVLKRHAVVAVPGDGPRSSRVAHFSQKSSWTVFMPRMVCPTWLSRLPADTTRAKAGSLDNS